MVGERAAGGGVLHCVWFSLKTTLSTANFVVEEATIMEMMANSVAMAVDLAIVVMKGRKQRDGWRDDWRLRKVNFIILKIIFVFNNSINYYIFKLKLLYL